jgi:hypothetical protein
VNFTTEIQFLLQEATFFTTTLSGSGTHPTYLQPHNKHPEIIMEFKNTQTQPERIKLLEI